MSHYLDFISDEKELFQQFVWLRCLSSGPLNGRLMCAVEINKYIWLLMTSSFTAGCIMSHIALLGFISIKQISINLLELI